jgi:PAS domain S-box-containing protein
MQFKSSEAWLRSILALAVPFVALGLQTLFWPIIQPYVWFLFYPAVFISSWIGGYRSGLASTVISAGLVWWFFIPPAHSFAAKSTQSLLSVAVFLGMGVLFSYFNGQLRKTNQKLSDTAEALARELNRSHELSRQMQQQSAMLSLVLENMAEGLVMADPSGHFQVYNRAAERILGVPGKDLPPSEWPKYYSAYLPDGSAPFPVEQIPLVRAMGGESCDGVEMQIRRPDEKSPIWILINGRPVRDAEGNLVGGVVVFRDITAQRHAEQQIRDLNRSLEQRAAELEAAVHDLEAFTYSVSHDLRAPLRHISGFTNILLEDFGGKMDAEQRRLCNRICEGARQMGQLVDDLLALSRVSRQPLHVQLTSLRNLLEEARRAVEAEAPGRAIEWRLGELPFVECDPALLRQVFVNLLSNAAKYTRPRNPAIIEVQLEPSNGRPAVVVRDNGVGFSMKYADKLFGVFQRLHRQEDFEGTGVGLATVQRILRRHGGEIWAEAEPNRGAAFYFTLPGLSGEAAGDSLPSAQQGANS